MPCSSVEGFTLAFFFDWAITLLTILGPLVLPYWARLGTASRVAAGMTLIGLGIFLGLLFWIPRFIDPDVHWVLANNLELFSLALLPLSLVLFLALPPFYIGLGIWVLLRGRKKDA